MAKRHNAISSGVSAGAAAASSRDESKKASQSKQSSDTVKDEKVRKKTPWNRLLAVGGLVGGGIAIAALGFALTRSGGGDEEIGAEDQRCGT